jgi:hypothetical protein
VTRTLAPENLRVGASMASCAGGAFGERTIGGTAVLRVPRFGLGGEVV